MKSDGRPQIMGCDGRDGRGGCRVEIVCVCGGGGRGRGEVHPLP